MALKRHLGLLHVFCISSGAMISSGIFILPGIAHAQAGPAVTLSYLIAALLAMTGMLSIAELSTAMPKAGGDYFFATRTMGPAVGTISGLLTWLSLSLKTAFALVGMSAFTRLFLSIDIRLIGLTLCVFFTLLNGFGVEKAGRFQVFLVIGLLILMVGYVILGMPAVQIRHFEPFAPHGYGAVFATAGLVFVSFGGLLKTSSVAEEVQNPGKVIPLALIFSLLIISFLYILMVFVTSGTVPASKLDGSLMPITEGARAFLGKNGAIAMSIAAILAFISTANAGIMAASRYLLAMSRDHLLPLHLGYIHPKHNVPSVAILTTGTVISISLFLDLTLLVKAASTVLILAYILANLSLIILRESHIQNYRPIFSAPLYPWFPIIGIIGCALLVVEMGAPVLWLTALLIGAGAFVYWFYGRIKSERDYALRHLVARITAREISNGNLESELKTIIRERDEIVADRFDQIIETCPVLDLSGAHALPEFFQKASEALAEPLAMDAAEINERLIAREQESNTAISADIAIPHIIMEGEGHFEILLARCREGINFSEESPDVKAVFVLAGTPDDRNFHLRALSSIAQIVQDPKFLKRWIAAKNATALRDIILLGRRQRTG
ncbi:MAG: amino acid permease [Kiritimatiellales bacterium]|nr:amino acid permease [Kiritimatiellales bacterium]